jgi:hypothetical protein
MSKEQQIFDIAKLLHDARMKECGFGVDRIKAMQDRFPTGLTPRQYAVPQSYTDQALAQARALLKEYDVTLKQKE